MLGARLATAAVAIPLLLAIVFWAPRWALAVLVFVLCVVAIAEYMTMAFADRPFERWLGLAAGVVVVGAASLAHRPGAGLAAAVTAVLAALLAAVVLRPVDLRRGLQDCALSVFGVLYVAVLAHFVWLHYTADGPYWVTFLIANGMASDTGAYFAGRAFGKRKLLPRVSPGKTVAGALGNLAAAAVAGLVCKSLFFPAEGWLAMVVLAVALAAIGQLGDLCESAIKRAFDTKESGSIFPGHGGVLDRIDSLLFPVAILYYYRLAL